MTTLSKYEILRLAREAGAVFDPQWGIASNTGTATFERFAALCRAPLVAEVERLKKMSVANIMVRIVPGYDGGGKVVPASPQEPTSAVPANAKPEKAKPYAWRNPMNGVVISNDKKERLLCVGAGYPNFSEPLYAAGQQYLKENGK